MKDFAMGWIRDYPDFRDYTPEHKDMKQMLKKVGITRVKAASPLPANMDLRKWCSPVEDQGNLGSCTAHAAANLVEYYENRAFGKYIDASRLFIYKTTRNLLNLKGDTGAYLRTALGSLVLFGAPPEKYWPYNISVFDQEPSAFCYSFGQSYKTISYFKLDVPNLKPSDLLTRIKQYLAAGIPSIFGFTVYNSYAQSNTTGKIPYPSPKDKVVGGHAVTAVGYDDTIEIINSASGKKTIGAILIKNSWGTGWGMQGYGWLSYDYVLNGLAVDWWSILSNQWIDTGNFINN